MLIQFVWGLDLFGDQIFLYALFNLKMIRKFFTSCLLKLNYHIVALIVHLLSLFHLLIPNGCICFDATCAYLILFYWYGLSPIPPEKKAEGRLRVDRDADNHQLLQLEEKDVVSTVATALSDICGPGEWMPMEKLHTVVSFFQPFSVNSCLYKVTTRYPGLGSWIWSYLPTSFA